MVLKKGSCDFAKKMTRKKRMINFCDFVKKWLEKRGLLLEGDFVKKMGHKME